MSTVKKEVKSKLVEKALQENSKLILTNKILSQIQHLHKEVGGVEWSGILVYSIVEGSIENHKDFVVKVEEVLPMDVGTSGYTEYELKPDSDDYTFENMSRVMTDTDLKMGHIHTHHNMSCFFSGTDKQELHDNSPNHNYYLSLIVNFKNYTDWCAKIAYVGEEEQEGVITSRYKGTTGDMVENSVTVKSKTEVLYTIDMDIEVEDGEELDKEFTDRVVELKKPKPVVRPTYNFKGWNRSEHKSTPVVGYAGYKNSKQTSIWDDMYDVYRWPDADTMSKLAKESVKVDVSAKSIQEFTLKVVSLTNEPTGTLENALKVLEDSLSPKTPTDESEANKEIYLEALADSYDDLFLQHFKVEVNEQSHELVANKISEYALDDSTMDMVMPMEILTTIWSL